MASTPAALVNVGGREVRISSPDRIVFEASGGTPALTKLDVCTYVSTVSAALMRSVGDRPTALERWPSGYREGMTLTVAGNQGDGFYSKRLPKGAPPWLETVRVHTPNGRPLDELCPSEPAAFVWAAQMGTLTFHPWPVRRPDVDHPDELRLDLDPQPRASFADVKRVAFAAKELLEELGLRGFVKTSGSRGLHIYVRIQTRWTFEDVRHAAIGLGRELARRDDAVTTAWWKEERGESSIFLDYNQNLRDRSVASAWSIRARPGAPVSTPMTWSALADCESARAMTVPMVPDYLADGDPWAEMDGVSHDIEPLLQLWNTLPGGELNWPPEYPKMPGEPLRVQPSRKATHD